MLIDHLVRGFPPNEMGIMRGVVDDLVRRNILVKIPKKYGDAVYINARHLKRILQALEASGLYPYLKRP
jgi:hypothetical protein